MSLKGFLTVRRLVFVLHLGIVTSLAFTIAPREVFASKSEQYRTRGVVRSFGKERSSVFIAHEDIPGYMNAMTMPFEPRSPAQLDGIATGDTVRFAFTATADGHRYIDALKKE